MTVNEILPQEMEGKIITTTIVKELILSNSNTASSSPSTSPEPEPVVNKQVNKPELPRYIQASPYTAFPHLLDLSTIDLPQQLLARALTIMTPLSPAYATTPYSVAFNFPSILARLRHLSQSINYHYPPSSFYIIVFRSRVNPSTNRQDLGALDEAAHIEAIKSGGLLKYWFGVPDENHRNLATCVWRDREDAKRGGAGEGHRRAMERVRGLYTEWKVERLRLVVMEGARDWRTEEWTD
ncbi:hypothetical protein BZA77DRAFT_306071 [Pyronema omphalodes]|nr:hypothetical protein BZA77DRAFT_306071 [Pyronema omphalodes]